jgi:hypothetical protein
MGRVRIRHYRIRKGRAYWEPTARMKALGFRVMALGPHGPEAWAQAERMNSEWDKARAAGNAVEHYDRGTLGWLFDEYRATGVWRKKEARTREEWEVAWTVIRPIFADVLVSEIDFPACDEFYTGLEAKFSLHKRHRVFKIFRALLQVAIGFKLITTNPTHRIANTAPSGRSAIWSEIEIAALRERAWEGGYRGLAVAIAIAHDTQLAPVDVRLLTPAMRKADQNGAYFETSRAKTGRKALATISRNTESLLDRYLADLPFVLPPDQPFIRNRSGHVYSKDTLGDDFRDVRETVFAGDTRRLMDMRRTGNVEAVAGGAQPPELAAKLSNTIGKSNEIFDTYSPVQLETVRKVDRHREIGRRELLAAAVARELEQNKSGNFPTPAPVSESELASKPSPTKKANG